METIRPTDPRKVGTFEPGRHTIVVRSQPLTMKRGLLGGAGALGTMLGVLAIAVAYGLGDFVVPIALATTVAWAVVILAPTRHRTTIQLRQNGLSITTGKHRVLLAYADISTSLAVRHTVHSELLLIMEDGSEQRLPMPGFQVAQTLEQALRLAKRRSAATQGKADPESRAALGRLLREAPE